MIVLTESESPGPWEGGAGVWRALRRGLEGPKEGAWRAPKRKANPGKKKEERM